MNNTGIISFRHQRKRNEPYILLCTSCFFLLQEQKTSTLCRWIKQIHLDSIMRRACSTAPPGSADVVVVQQRDSLAAAKPTDETIQRIWAAKHHLLIYIPSLRNTFFFAYLKSDKHSITIYAVTYLFSGETNQSLVLLLKGRGRVNSGQSPARQKP
jgi:hypothetical protein